MPLSSKFIAKSTGEKIVEIDQYLARIWTKCNSLLFLAHLAYGLSLSGPWSTLCRIIFIFVSFFVIILWLESGLRHSGRCTKNLVVIFI